jgi:hypothetical protein
MKTTQLISNKKRINKAEWLIPAGLILLSLVPMLAGTFRIVELSSGAEVTPENARFFASPLPVVVHIISVSLFSLIGALQFAPSLRRWKRGGHQTLGKWLLVPCGLVAALSGLWMTQFYPWPQGDGEVLYAMRLLFGSAMLLSIILGVIAVRQRDYVGHGEWMIRGYAIGLGAGTQVLTHIPMLLFPGMVGQEMPRAIMMGAGWIINIAVAEWVIRKRRATGKRPKRISAAAS